MRRFIVIALSLSVFISWTYSSVSLAEECVNCAGGDGYWVVSTYEMPQELNQCPDCSQFRVYYKPVCGELRASSCQEMLHSLNPNLPTCIHIHGSFVNVDDALNDARFTYSWLLKGQPCCRFNMIFFVWPSDDIKTMLPNISVIRNGLLADHNGMYLSSLVDHLPCSSPICMMGHSHGTRVISSCLHYRGGGEVQNCKRPSGCAPPRNIRTVFAAAAINHEWLVPGEKFGQALSQTNCLLTLVNRKDIALTIYPMVGRHYGRALSKTGTTLLDERRLGPYLDKIQEVDLTFDVGFRHSWSIYYSHLGLAKTVTNFMFQGQCRQHSTPAPIEQQFLSPTENLHGKFPFPTEPTPIVLPEPSSDVTDRIPLLPAATRDEPVRIVN